MNFIATSASTAITGFNSPLTINALAYITHDSGSLYTGNAAGNGIAIAGGAGAVTINVPIVLGGSSASQTWTNSSGNLCTIGVNGTITGSAASGTQSLTLVNAGSQRDDRQRHLISDVLGGGSVALVVNNTGAGVTTLSNSGNSYSGGTTLKGGTLTSTVAGGFGAGNVTVNPTNATGSAADNATLNTTGSIASIAAVTVNSEASDAGFGLGTINFNGAAPTIGSVAGNGSVVLNSAGGTALTIGSTDNLSSVFSGVIINGEGRGASSRPARAP